MKQYRIIEVTKSDAEYVMNDMSRNGWEVVSTSLDVWSHLKPYLIITFSKTEPDT